MYNLENIELRTTIELLELLRKYQKNQGFSDTDYRLAKVLSMTPQGIAHMLQHGGIMSDDTAMKVAFELKLPPSYVLLCAWHERNKNQATKDAIQEIAAKYMKVSVFILISSAILNAASLLHTLA